MDADDKTISFPDDVNVWDLTQGKNVVGTLSAGDYVLYAVVRATGEIADIYILEKSVQPLPMV